MSGNDTPKKRSRGRPSIPNEEKKKYTISFRARGDIKDKLEVFAKKSGRSISEEVEHIISISIISSEYKRLSENYMPNCSKEISDKIIFIHAQSALFTNLDRAFNQSIFNILAARISTGYQDSETKNVLDDLSAKIENVRKLFNEKKEKSMSDFKQAIKEAEKNNIKNHE